MTRRGNVDVRFGDAGEPEAHEIGADRPDPEAPFRILVLGDFSGRKSRGVVESLSGRRPARLDRDEGEKRMAELATRIRVPIGEHVATVRIRSLDDFHPDRLIQSVDVLEDLFTLRGRLDNPMTYPDAAEKISAIFGFDAPAPSASRPAPTPFAGSALDAILDAGDAPLAERPAAPIGDPELARLVGHLVKGHTIPGEDPGKARLAAAVEEAVSALLRTLLHDPGFMAVESAWRGVHLLLDRLDTDGPLELHILDVSSDELTADLAGADSRLVGVIGETDPDDETPRWALLVGLQTFGPTDVAAAVLSRLARVAARLRAPFIAAADSRLAGCRSFGESGDPDDWTEPLSENAEAAWRAVRSLPTASSVGLVMPRLLMRLPYGKATEPAESFAFEEWTTSSAHEDYLWGSGAIAAALVLGTAFSADRWELKDEAGDISAVPLHVWREGAETRVTPCAEANVAMRGYERLLALGFMPLLSFKGRDEARLSAFQSIAGKPLTGRWG